MTKPIPIVRSVSELRQQVSVWKSSGLKVGLVPTMGALHKGHLSLVDAISKDVDRVVVSIFVNPTQFGENEDLDKYPRQEAEDCLKLAETPANLVFAPSVSEMYPDGHITKVTLSGITEILEGAERPGHFDGVSTIVTKLLLQCLPDVAIFGEKDYQQLAVIRQFVRDLDIPVKILGGTLVREEDGLAYSSRNAYLNSEDRAVAGQFNVILKALVDQIQRGASIAESEEQAKQALLNAGFKAVDYVSVVEPVTLQPISEFFAEARVLAVARVGGVRLLDNMPITPISSR
jgi:pantoate--beta-alanine ligase